jgi:hypothetical protein
LLLAVIAAAVPAGVQLDWPEQDCPSEAEVRHFLAAVVPGTSARSGSAVLVRGRRDGDRWMLEIAAGGERFARSFGAEASCDEQAATAAAIIAGYLGLHAELLPADPDPDTAGALTPTAPTADRVATATAIAPIGEPPPPAPAPEALAPIVEPGGPKNRTAEPAPPAGGPSEPLGGYLAAALLLAADAEGASPGLAIGGGVAIGGALSLGLEAWGRWPRAATPSAGGRAEMFSFGAGAVAAYRFAPEARLEVGLGVDLAYAHSTGVDLPGDALLVSLRPAAGVAWRPFSPLELGVHGAILANQQRFLVDQEQVLARPVAEVVATAGVRYP